MVVDFVWYSRATAAVAKAAVKASKLRVIGVRPMPRGV